MSLFLLSLSLSCQLFNDDNNEHSSGWLSLSVHTVLTCSEGQSACTLAHSLSGEHVRIMQETIVQAFLCKPGTSWKEAGLLLCWRWRGVPKKCDVSVLCVLVGIDL